MRIFSPTRWLRELPVPHKFYIIVSLIILILLFELGSSWFVINTLSGIRAYVGGEGLWSKAQKESVGNLLKYTNTFNEADYEKFLSSLKIPLGDKRARLELEKENPDLSVARQGFLDGGNHEDDIDSLIFLFQKFRRVSYMNAAIDIWTRGDTGIEQQIGIGESIHKVIRDSQTETRTPRETSTDILLSPLIEQVVAVDKELTMLENDFSAVLGEAYRRIGAFLLVAVFVLVFLLGLICLMVTLFISRVVTQVDRAKNEFIALASHQLKTPPTTIKLLTDRLLGSKMGTFTEKQKEYLNDIQSSNQRMIDLVNVLLNMSRIEMGIFSIQVKASDPCIIVQNIVDELKPAIDKKQLRLKTIFLEKNITLMIDEQLFRMVISNLVINAVHYTAEGGEIRIECKVVNKGQTLGEKILEENCFLIIVSDTGYGIPQEQQRNVFTKLFRADNVREKHTDGTGLGLYLVKSILDHSGGSIWFTSHENYGSAFYAAIPMSGMKARSGEKGLIG